MGVTFCVVEFSYFGLCKVPCREGLRSNAVYLGDEDKGGSRDKIVNTKVVRRACAGRGPGKHSPSYGPTCQPQYGVDSVDVRAIFPELPAATGHQLLVTCQPVLMNGPMFVTSPPTPVGHRRATVGSLPCSAAFYAEGLQKSPYPRPSTALLQARAARGGWSGD